ncbi:MAG TPA: hypothetical protein VD999_04985 [Vitreimonas sp.]|nr:hypothetical protein [Vitreimonas sp.]
MSVERNDMQLRMKALELARKDAEVQLNQIHTDLIYRSKALIQVLDLSKYQVRKKEPITLDKVKLDKIVRAFMEKASEYPTPLQHDLFQAIEQQARHTDISNVLRLVVPDFNEYAKLMKQRQFNQLPRKLTLEMNNELQAAFSKAYFKDRKIHSFLVYLLQGIKVLKLELRGQLELAQESKDIDPVDPPEHIKKYRQFLTWIQNFEDNVDALGDALVLARTWGFDTIDRLQN